MAYGNGTSVFIYQRELNKYSSALKEYYILHAWGRTFTNLSGLVLLSFNF
jgi:hypothetical protein